MTHSPTRYLGFYTAVCRKKEPLCLDLTESNTYVRNIATTLNDILVSFTGPYLRAAFSSLLTDFSKNPWEITQSTRGSAYATGMQPRQVQ